MTDELPKSKHVKEVAPGELNFDQEKMGARETKKNCL